MTDFIAQWEQMFKLLNYLFQNVFKHVIVISDYERKPKNKYRYRTSSTISRYSKTSITECELIFIIPTVCIDLINRERHVNKVYN